MLSEHLTWEQIQRKYPDQWIGIANVEYEADNAATIKSATVIYTNKNKNELAEIQLDTDGKVLSRYTTPDNVFQIGSVGYFE